MEEIIIYGAGGHAKAVIDAVEEEAKYKIVGLVDDIQPKGMKVLGYEILGDGKILPDLMNSGIRYCIIAIGENEVRSAKTEYVSKIGFRLVSVVHPFSCIGKNVSIGEGTVILQGTLIDPNVFIGKGAIINAGAIIGHDCKIGNFAHVSGGAICGGGVSVGESSLIGIGVKIAPKVRIGKQTFIGIGSVVTKDLPDGVTAVGVPARIIKGN